jgi:hypothetical protein
MFSSCRRGGLWHALKHIKGHLPLTTLLAGSDRSTEALGHLTKQHLMIIIAIKILSIYKHRTKDPSKINNDHQPKPKAALQINHNQPSS